ncbi:MAG: PIG-L family deacetylase [Proteobacteria bacterium]|nr:PIG-L family deacetylase [Pseudomonadota bacterium]
MDCQRRQSAVIFLKNMTNKKNILIISPHPDDDVIGMGGTIVVKAHEGCNFTIVYVTNGGGSVKEGAYKDFSKEEIIKIRKLEAESSIQMLLDNPHQVKQIFLDFNSSDLFENPDLYIKELSNILGAKKFDEIYIPYPEDRHPTHKAVAKLSLETIRAKDVEVQIFAYETWDSIPITEDTVYVDITPYYKRKLSAVSCHKSQCSITPYDEGILAKNRYNAVYRAINTKNKMEYAEVFLAL